MKSKRAYLAVALAVVMSMSACGKKKTADENETTTLSTTETTTSSAESTTSAESSTTAASTVVTTTSPAAQKQEVKSSEIVKNTADSEPKTDAASPVAGVSNAVFLDVSNIVREEASNSYREILQDYFKEDKANEARDIKDIDATLKDWEKLYKDSNDKAYAETGCSLIMAYSKLAALDNIINANMDKLSNDILAEHDKIAFDLQGNVEIFLNTSNITAIASDKDFSCIDRITELRSKAEEELSKPVEITQEQTE